ncbi:MAG: hypothetical protein R3C49_05930 [Planctomycetaceae bacterium]
MPGVHHREPESSIDRRSADVAIVCSHHTELRPLIRKLDRQKNYVEDGAVFRGGFVEENLRVAIVEAGSGFARHRHLTETLIREHHPAWVISVGFSSGLASGMKSGDVALATDICDTHGNSLPVKCSIPGSKRVFVGKHVVTDSHPAAACDRQKLAESSSALAVDTTSLAVAQACESSEEGQPAACRFMSIRGILGDPEADIPAQILGVLFQPVPPPKGGALQKWTGRLRPDPSLKEWSELATETALNMNRFLFSIIQQLAEKFGKSR